MERLILTHLRSVVSPTLDPLQFAYRPNIGAEDAVIYFLQRTLSHLEPAGSAHRAGQKQTEQAGQEEVRDRRPLDSVEEVRDRRPLDSVEEVRDRRPLDSVEEVRDRRPLDSVEEVRDRRPLDSVEEVRDRRPLDSVEEVRDRRPLDSVEEVRDRRPLDSVEEVRDRRPLDSVEEVRDRRPLDSVEEVRDRRPLDSVEEVRDRRPLDSVEEVSDRRPLDSVEEVRDRRPLDSVEEVRDRRPLDSVEELLSPRSHPPQLPLSHSSASSLVAPHINSSSSSWLFLHRLQLSSSLTPLTPSHPNTPDPYPILRGRSAPSAAQSLFTHCSHLGTQISSVLYIQIISPLSIQQHHSQDDTRASSPPSLSPPHSSIPSHPSPAYESRTSHSSNNLHPPAPSSRPSSQSATPPLIISLPPLLSHVIPTQLHRTSNPLSPSGISLSSRIDSHSAYQTPSLYSLLAYSGLPSVPTSVSSTPARETSSPRSHTPRQSPSVSPTSTQRLPHSRA
uniref:Uncharacterized protein n=1 Tax=Knipowitschia caucasica TaxID=637954 RepID=A0AAV2MLV8_KNICA